ncbi:MAG TPA: TIM44-like domain-containing protein [Usitatibacter sp.]|nr:TIM44-like domain-containing protein [Usitatibacter sp.]
MKKLLPFMILALSLGLASLDSDAAKRFGGGGNLGKQRTTPLQKDAAPSAAPTSPSQAAKPAQPSPAAAPAALPAAKPSFMQRWGGLLMGLGIGAVLASLFGAQMGPIVGMLLMGLLVVAAIFLVMRLLAARRPASAPQFQSRSEPVYDAARPAPSAGSEFSGIGSRVGGGSTGATTGPWSNTTAISTTKAANDPAVVLGGPVEPFLRVAKTSFLRLQAANDAGDLDDIRDYTTPEMYAEIAMQIRDRGGDPQKTEVLNVDASITDAAIEGDYAYASVRFWGLLRETPGANPEPFDEVWHVRRKAGNAKDPWVIAGIQQVA